MSYDPFDPANIPEYAPCMPCCGAAAECSCALLIPGVPNYDPVWAPNNPYASYADAKYAVDNFVVNCIVWNSQYSAFYDNYVTYDSYTATFDGTTLDIAGQVTEDGPANNFNGVVGWASFTVPEGTTVSSDYSCFIESDDPSLGLLVNIYSCDGIQVFAGNASEDGENTVSGTFTTDPLPAGEYIIWVLGAGADSGGLTTASFSITADDVFTVNPVIALWDDSGTTRKLWACPKLLLPPLTESTGDWYADCAAAAAVLTDPLRVASCIAYSGAPGGIDSFSASGGSSLSMTEGASGGDGDTADFTSGINAEAGETLSCSISTDGGLTVAAMTIYDYDGNLVESVDCSGGGGTSSPLPYTGPYIVIIGGEADSPTFSSFSVSVTSSGTLTVNPIQARYDGGLDCPNTLDCGDSCP